MKFSGTPSQVNKKIKEDFMALPKKFQDAQSRAFFRIGVQMRQDAVKNAPAKSGQLRRSIMMMPNSASIIKNKVAVGTNLKYARIQDMGGTITPKRTQYLTIPLGGTRGTPRNHAGFFFKSRSGNLLYGQKSGSGIKPLFVLKKSVTLQAKPYLIKAFNKMKKSEGLRIIDLEMKKINA